MKCWWLCLLTAGVLLGSAAAGWGFFGPRERTGTNLTRDQYATLPDGLAIPPTASDISLYTRKAWGEEMIVISFTVPDEQTFVDWVTPRWGSPSGVGFVRVRTFDGGQLGLREPREHLSVVDGRRGQTHFTLVVFDRQTRRVYYSHETGSAGGED